MSFDPEQSLRADLWLWHARFFKTRALASEFLGKGRAKLTRHGQTQRLDKPARSVHPGDELVFSIGGRVFSVRVLGLGERRGPAPEARALYEDLSPPSGSIAGQNQPD